MRSILAKLDAGDRTHAVTIAVKRGFLEKIASAAGEWRITLPFSGFTAMA